MQALLLRIGADSYAVDLAAVREVVPRADVTPLPRGPRAALGVFNLRGEVIPLFDTGVLLGVGRARSGGHIAVVETASGVAGLAADGAARRTTLGAPAGPATVPGGVERRAIDTEESDKGGVVTLLDVDALLVG
jgi:purine-binding chemotaxis protein CheW